VHIDGGEIVVSGYDSGITTVANSKNPMNGDVQVAEGDFAMWIGRSVLMMCRSESYSSIPASLHATERSTRESIRFRSAHPVLVRPRTRTIQP